MPPPVLQHEMTHQDYEAAVRERFVALFPQPGFEVIGGPACHRRGRFSEVPRQIDVAVVERDAPGALHLVADAKRHANRLDVPDVEAFLGCLDDLGCRRGVLASLLGGTPGACRRAAAGGIELHVVSYREALLLDWPRIAAGLYPWDHAYHPVLAEALRFLHRGRVEECLEAIEVLPFEEWDALFSRAPAHVRGSTERVLRVIAESHHDDAWRYNALRVLDESYDLPEPTWLAELLSRERDTETREQIEDMLARG